MSDNPVATTGAPDAENTPAQPNAVSQPPAPVDVEAIRKSARLEAQREANAAAQRREAALHKQYQTREKELKAAAANSMKKVGYDDPDAIFGDVEVHQKARQFDALQAEADNAARWEQFKGETASDYGLDPNDDRLREAVSAQDLQAKARAAMREDAAKEREKVLAEARAEAVKQATAKVENGDLEVLGGAPSAPALGLDDKYKKEMLAARGKGNNVGRAIRDKYRAEGVDVDRIVIR